MVKRFFIATFVAVSPLYAFAQGLITGHIKEKGAALSSRSLSSMYRMNVNKMNKINAQNTVLMSHLPFYKAIL